MLHKFKSMQCLMTGLSKSGARNDRGCNTGTYRAALIRHGIWHPTGHPMTHRDVTLWFWKLAPSSCEESHLLKLQCWWTDICRTASHQSNQECTRCLEFEAHNTEAQWQSGTSASKSTLANVQQAAYQENTTNSCILIALRFAVVTIASNRAT